MNLKFLFLLYPAFIISLLIDLNRVPFDLIESESELVSGFNTEYFFSEYINLLFIRIILVIIFYDYYIEILYLI